MALERSGALTALLATLAIATPVDAADPDTPPQPPARLEQAESLELDLDVVAKRLDRARQQIQPNLGASTYDFTPQALQEIPQGENAPLDRVLLQAPGVAQDSFGQIHVRGEHANADQRGEADGSPVGACASGRGLEDHAQQGT